MIRLAARRRPILGTQAPHTRILLATMDDAFFVEHYPWWAPLFERFEIDSDLRGGACGCSDDPGACTGDSCQIS